MKHYSPEPSAALAYARLLFIIALLLFLLMPEYIVAVPYATAP